MSKLLKVNKNFIIAFMQGRFSAPVGSNYQYFPIHEWDKEFIEAKKIGFNNIEWIISDFSNPIFNQEFQKIIKNVLKKNKFKITSISLDLLMQSPLKKMTLENARWLSKSLLIAIKKFKIQRISFPIEEHSRFNNNKEKIATIRSLEIFYKILEKHCNLCIETDISPKALGSFLKNKKLSKLGILIDLGNTKAHGFSIKDYFEKYSNKIYSAHLKFREDNFGISKPIPKKDYYELEYFIKNINLLKNFKDLTFQTFKSPKNFIIDIKKSVRNFNNYV
jgi:hypothetical protein